ncbi:hypothetical protein FH972_022580 [Carpinus fangiana]|uniref:F-box domain-containing protein n=1 Tax=Carpinus fangiana TaxID=176857 RepID=A0A5N6KTB8_9ROSI|nr:hypothetical protein FH972_022580 [Carpinus fangiana]
MSNTSPQPLADLTNVLKDVHHGATQPTTNASKYPAPKTKTKTRSMRQILKDLTRFPLQRLPIEIQRKILQYLLVRDDAPLLMGWIAEAVDDNFDSFNHILKSHVHVYPEILRASKFYAIEGRRILYEENVFGFHSNADGSGGNEYRMICDGHPGIFDNDGELEGIEDFTAWATPAEFALVMRNSTANLIKHVYVTEAHGETFCPHNLDFLPLSPSRVLVDVCAQFRRTKHATLAFLDANTGIGTMMHQQGRILSRLPLTSLSCVWSQNMHKCWLDTMIADPAALKKLGWVMTAAKQPLPPWFKEISDEQVLGNHTFMRVFKGAT